MAQKGVAPVTGEAAGNVDAWITAAQTVLSSPAGSVSEEKISLWHDPDPVMTVVDVRSDSEFLDGLDGLQSDYSSDHNRRRSSVPSPQISEIRLWREQSLQSQPPKTSTRATWRRNSRELAAIQQVLRNMRVRDESVEERSVTVTEGSVGIEKEEGGVGSDRGNIALCSYDGGELFYFPSQTIALSRVFATMMEQERFEGEIMLAEKSSTVELLGAWMSRDLEFEITVGTRPPSPQHCTNMFYQRKTITMNFCELPRNTKSLVLRRMSLYYHYS